MISLKGFICVLVVGIVLFAVLCWCYQIILLKFRRELRRVKKELEGKVNT